MEVSVAVTSEGPPFFEKSTVIDVRPTMDAVIDPSCPHHVVPSSDPERTAVFWSALTSILRGHLWGGRGGCRVG